MPVSQFSRRLRVTSEENNFPLAPSVSRWLEPILKYVKTAAVKLFRFNVVRPLSILLLCTLGWHCGREAPPPPIQTSVSNIQIQANPNNVLSAVVSADVSNAASVRVEYAADDGSDAGSTPDFDVTRKSSKLPVLGLMPQT